MDITLKTAEVMNISAQENTNSEVTEVSENKTEDTTANNVATEDVVAETANEDIATETANEENKVINLSEVTVEGNTFEVPEIDYDRFIPIVDFSKSSDEEICYAACNKLMQDTYFGINGLPLLACFLWAYNKAKTDLEFAKNVCVKSKNFTKAFEHLKKVVTSNRSGNGVGLDHRQIFAILEEYFAIDDAEVARKEAEAQAKAKAERAAKAASTKAAKKASSKKDAKAPKESKSKTEKGKTEKKKKKPESDKNSAQLSLDELLGGI